MCVKSTLSWCIRKTPPPQLPVWLIFVLPFISVWLSRICEKMFSILTTSHNCVSSCTLIPPLPVWKWKFSLQQSHCFLLVLIADVTGMWFYMAFPALLASCRQNAGWFTSVFACAAKHLFTSKCGSPSLRNSCMNTNLILKLLLLITVAMVVISYL